MDDKDLLRCLVHLVGRAAIPLVEVSDVIGSGKKQIKAFNLFDGTRTLKEVGRKAKINRGNLSRTTSRWLQHGIVFWVGEGKEARLLHIYPVPEKKRRYRRKK